MAAAALLQCCATALLNLGYAWLVGALAACLWLAPAPAPWAHAAATALRRSMPLAALLVLLAHGVGLWCAAAAMSELPMAQAGAALWTMLGHTGYGRFGAAAWLAMLGVAGVAGVTGVAGLALAPRRYSRAAVAASLALAGLLLAFGFFRAALSHAGENGLASLGFAVEWLHLLLIALWVGAVAVAAWQVLPRAGATDLGHGVEAYLAALSQAASVALAGILATGVFNAVVRLGSVAGLQGNPYATALALKLVLVLLAIAMGAYNRFVGFPACVARRQVQAHVVTLLRLEAVVLALALLAAGVLTAQQPPASF